MHQLDCDGKKYLLDCGLYQGHRREAQRWNRDLPFDARSIQAVVLSHAHIDHSGDLPTLAKNGFSGPIYATPPTIDLCDAMLRDTAHIQEKDFEFIKKRRQRPNQRPIAQGDEGPVEPLYTMADAERTIPLFQPVLYHATKSLDANVS